METREKLKAMLEEAVKHQEQWLESIKDKDSGSKANQEYNEYFKKMAEEFKEKQSIDYGRYLFDQWGNYGKEPGEVNYSEVVLNGVRCMLCEPHDCEDDRVIIACHGGAFMYGSIYSHRKMYASIGKKAKSKVLIVDYGRLPEVAWPQPVEDLLLVYKCVLENGVSSKRIVVAGDSAGGNMAITMPYLCKERGLPTPAGLVLMSPWGDLEAKTPAYEVNNQDVLNSAAMIRQASSMLAESADLHSPTVSPVYINDFSGYPPMYIQVGGCENFVDEDKIIAGKAFECAVEVKCEVVENMQHCFQQMTGYCKDATKAVTRIGKWINSIFDK